MAAAIGRVLGRRVRTVTTPVGMLAKIARFQGISPFEISGLRHNLRDHDLGAFKFETEVTDVVRDVTGRPAEDFETTARRHAGLPFARRSIANRLRAWVNFGDRSELPDQDSNLEKQDQNLL